MGEPSILLLRLKGPMMGWGGVKMDAFGDVSPIPLVSSVTGMLACALGVPRAHHKVIQRIQDTISLGVAILTRGEIEIDFQTADLAKTYMTGPMWTVEGVPFKRDGSGLEAKRIVQKPYIAGADLLVVAALDGAMPFERREIEDALTEPAHPLVLGRVSCPPSLDLFHGWAEGDDLETALLDGARGLGRQPEELWLPAAGTPARPGDIFVGIAGRRDWRLHRHVGSETFLRRLVA